MIATASRPTISTIVLAALLAQGGYAQSLVQRSQQGVLLLKHGTTLSGFITPAGDRYNVLLGESGEARVPAADVVAVVSDLQAAYEFKRKHLNESLGARFDLAQWCLQHEMPARAADQLLAAESLYGWKPELESLHQRLLALAKARTAAHASTEPESAIAKVSFETELGNLPSNAIDTFTSTVQPLLLNRCATGGCHNLRGTSAFRLFRPFTGQATTRRMTEGNLQVTLAYIDRANPLESILLSKAAEAHGGATMAAIEAREQRQLDVLTEWVSNLGSTPRPFEPPTIEPTNQFLYQPGQLPSTASSDAASEPLGRPPVKTDVAPVGDPFDPALFNRRHHGSTK